ncbi:MAG: hypothetical protein FWD64_10935 [Acidobacteriaceae bacterium]|nr:hypothetical protein [Acidobacteriaceae bacterium]
MREERTVGILRKDGPQLAILFVCAVGMFALTKLVAARVEAIDSRVAGFWYQDGLRKSHAGAGAGSIESFRKSVAIESDNPTYVLAFTDALAAGGHQDEAKQELLRLLAANPADPQVNLHLARLAAAAGQVQDAVHYYHSALDGLPAGEAGVEQRRDVRQELIYFLIGRHDESRARAELLTQDGDTQ